VLAHCRVEHASEKYSAWIASDTARICLAEVKAAPVGYVVITVPDLPVEISSSDMEVKRIYLLHRFQGTGVGRALMQWAVQTARAMDKTRLLLAVNARNAKAIAFYAKYGFNQVGTREFKVGNGIYHDLVLGMEL
jgi:ribosomal protein S18 acetylase RimI-like enzyme